MPTLSKTKTVTLFDGRVFRGSVVLDQKDTLDLVWTDRDVDHQVCIPKELITTVEPG